MYGQLINQYYTKREKLIQFGGSKNELSMCDAFKELFNYYAEKKNLMLIPEIAVQGIKGAKVKPAGTLKNACILLKGKIIQVVLIYGNLREIKKM